MKHALLFALFAAIALCGCIQPQPLEECGQFCQGQPHIQCVGSWKISGAYPDCNCFFECEAAPVKQCAGEGEQYSLVYASEYPEKCCEGLTEWESGMDSRISIADQCYGTGALKGSPVGTCINCGNGECEGGEQPCNCPQDCAEKGKSDYNSVEEFCSFGFSGAISQECSASALELPLCDLCTQEQPLARPVEELNCGSYVYSNCPDGCVRQFVPDSAQCEPGQLAMCTVNFDVAGSCVEPQSKVSSS